MNNTQNNDMFSNMMQSNISSNNNSVGNNSGLSQNPLTSGTNLSNNNIGSTNANNSSGDVVLNPVFPNGMVGSLSNVNEGINVNPNNNTVMNNSAGGAFINTNTNSNIGVNPSNNTATLDFDLPKTGANNLNSNSFVNFDSTSSNGVGTNNLVNNGSNNLINNNSNAIGSTVTNTSSNNLNNVGVGVVGDVNQPSVQQPINSGSDDSINVVNRQNENMAEVVSVKKYLIHFILMCIPIVGFIVLIIRALNKEDKNISNLAKAQLLLIGIALGISVLFIIIFSAIVGVGVATAL